MNQYILVIKCSTCIYKTCHQWLRVIWLEWDIYRYHCMCVIPGANTMTVLQVCFYLKWFLTHITEIWADVWGQEYTNYCKRNEVVSYRISIIFGPIFYLQLGKVLANKRRHNISKVFSQWLRPCPAKGKWKLLNFNSNFNSYYGPNLQQLITGH